jgi:serine phosphatase RsbU (regulator of sigma subunit)
MKMKELKIKVYGFIPLNKKQFLFFYSIFCLAFIFLIIYFLIYPLHSVQYTSKFSKLVYENFSLFWLIMLFWTLIEGQFYWTKFVKMQLKIIENQNKQILEQNKQLIQQKEEIQTQRDEIELQRDEILVKNSVLEQQKEEIQTQRDELEIQRDYVTNQRDEISKQNKLITDSINYAKRIQSALLSPHEQIDNFFDENFILYKPRDIVSGDFYWFEVFENKIIIAVADCTGHGVPGAFMSMLGISFLNEIFKSYSFHLHDIKSNDILNQLRDEIKISLHQTGKFDENKDGMDIALCIFDRGKNLLQFSGAHNPIYIVRAGELIELKPDKQPIGIYLKELPFTKIEFELKKSDTIYMFSDGYCDQFGGEKNEKFKSKRFKELLVKIQDKNISEQKIELEKNLELWSGKNEQVDDILVTGIKY